MSISLVILLYFVGSLCMWYELINRNTPKTLILIFMIIFVFTVLSRIENYHTYSDLGAYLERFRVQDHSYFGIGYQIFTNLIGKFFGYSDFALIITISLLNIVSAFLTVVIISTIRNENISNQTLGNNKFIGTFLFIFTMYWGLSFSAEVIRSGIAITLSLLVIALLMRNRVFSSIIVYIIALTFHWTQILLLPMLIIIKCRKSLKLFDRSIFIFWFILLLFLDLFNFSSIIISVVRIVLNLVLEFLSLSFHYSVYLDMIGRIGTFSYITRQYIFYRFTGLLFLFGDIKNRNYNIFVFGYFLSLTIFSLFNNFEVITRVQWIYSILSVFALYYFIKENKKYTFELKGIILLFYMLLQTVMTIFYLK